MTLQVIGTGFGRTGIDSMREALNFLGFGPCHNMMEVIGNAEQTRRWRAHVAGQSPGWESLFEGFNSCIDWPSAHYWPQLIEAYPEAKILLTYRSPESWWASFEKTILVGINKNVDEASLGLALIKNKVFGGKPGDRAEAIARYEANVRAVMESAPKERLLVHDLGDGWEPLCRFLGVSVPQAPYPSRNATGEFQQAFKDQFPPR